MVSDERPLIGGARLVKLSDEEVVVVAPVRSRVAAEDDVSGEKIVSPVEGVVEVGNMVVLERGVVGVSELIAVDGGIL